MPPGQPKSSSLLIAMPGNHHYLPTPMSTASDPSNSTHSPREEQVEILESLTGLHIKGFQDCPCERNANTPSSASDSLSTPPDMKTSLVVPVSFWKVWIENHHTLTPNAPNAPLLRDYDSFTEGTGHESFDFPLIAGDDEGSCGPLFFHPAENFPVVDVSNLEELDVASSPTETNEAVMAWMAGLSDTPEEPSSPPTPPSPEEPPSPSTPSRKRRRSFTQDREAEERRVRLWSPTIDSPYVLQQEPEDFSDNLECREEPETPG